MSSLSIIQRLSAALVSFHDSMLVINWQVHSAAFPACGSVCCVTKEGVK